MWKKSARFIGRYLAIGVLVGIGLYAIEEIHWRLFGAERVAMLQQSMERLGEAQEKLLFEPLLNSLEEKQSETAASCESNDCSDLLRPTPYFVNGKIKGYRVYPGSDRQGFRELQLRPGDLITEINGQPLDDSTAAMELFEKAISGQPAQFTALRDDEPTTIEINVDQSDLAV